MFSSVLNDEKITAVRIMYFIEFIFNNCKIVKYAIIVELGVVPGTCDNKRMLQGLLYYCNNTHLRSFSPI